MTETLSPRQRVLLALNHEEPDFVPYHIPIDSDYLPPLSRAAPQAYDLLKELSNHLPHFPLESAKHWVDDSSYLDDFGCGWKEYYGVPHLVDPPLKEPNLTGLRMPDLVSEKYFLGIEEFLTTHETDYRLCGIVFGFFDRGWALRGLENFLSDVVLNVKFVEALCDILVDTYIRLIDKIAAYPFDGIRFADDWGYQRGIIVGAKRWKTIFLPGLRKIFQHARTKNLAVMVHCDGDLTEIIPDLIEAGVQILNPIQPECMDILWLKQEYGNHLCFNGGISSQYTLPLGSPRQVQREVQACLHHLGKGGGYIIGPTKSLNTNIPVENALAALESMLHQTPKSCPQEEGGIPSNDIEDLRRVYLAFHNLNPTEQHPG